MGARRRRTGRRLSQAPGLPADLSVAHDELVMPLLAVAYGLLLAAFLFGLDQLVVIQSEGPWLEVAGAAGLGGSLLTTGILAVTAWRRHREGMPGRGLAWAAAATLSGVVGIVAALFVVSAIQVLQLLSGADVHLTRPVLESLPRPNDATLMAQKSGAAGTESAYQDLRTNQLEQIPDFYRSALTERGWSQESSSLDNLLRFRKGDFVVTVLLGSLGGASNGPGQFTVTVDRIPARPSATPAASPSP